MRNRILILNMLFFIIQNLYSQNMRINYDMTYKEDSLSSESVTKKMVLLIHGEESKFYTEKQYKVDSLRSNGLKGFAVGDNSFMVIKKPQNSASKYYFVFRDNYKLTESEKLNWKIEKETTKKNNYTCQKATLNYKGRSWEAWFTQEIPIQEGPYIFKGLPGLIVYMKDATNSYEFSFTGLKKNYHLLEFENMQPRPIEISKEKLDKVFLDYFNDPYREMRSGNVKAKFKDEKGNDIEPNFKEMTKNTQDDLIKNNNPIELTNAVKYPKSL
ncbi:GLPGLI family protein [Chryseobacterium sp. W4I1]|uniref:GLPGLI family protein n=1 Tax=Chryseobacterium sp. W4I1 TaxID=3042293 RepID=UPI00278137F4|nr:GLPGLI family protein [Chryseobacterium sp. W4I1]MDQ0780933.1 GLPGLI family protein [Chryseobacterium sp. W4I1]